VSTTPIDFYSTGKRKTSVARVHLRPGSGEFRLNERGLDEYFGGIEALKQIIKQPFALTETNDKFDVVATIHGGGVSSQAGAIRHGISRALCAYDAELRGKLKKAGFLTRDARIKERKKYGQKGARRRFQFSKR
jgi:small subunit ribosomal protein S9